MSAPALIWLVGCAPPPPVTPLDPVETGDTAPVAFDPYAEGFVGSADAGAGRFVTRCAACHGVDGRGGLGPDLADRVPVYDDLTLYRIISEGLGAMPAIAVGPQEGVDIVAWLRQNFP